MNNGWTIAWTTYGDTVRRPLYYILLAAFALLIFFSNFLALFTFNQEANMVREMGIASIALWGFLIVVVLAPVLVTQELEDRTAITLLAKPVTRSAFLVGKYAGLVMASFAGMLVLACVLFYTLWWMSRGDLIGAEPESAGGLAATGLILLAAGAAAEIRSRLRDPDSDRSRRIHAVGFVLIAAGAVALITAAVLSTGDRSRADAAWQAADLRDRSVWHGAAAFLRESGVIVAQGFLLSFLQVCILGSICVSLAAFAPPALTVAATALVYMIGNLSTYLLAGFEGSGHAAVRVLGRGIYYLLPNLGYFNLQTHFSEGSIISGEYVGLALIHAALYCSIVFLISCAAFEKGEIR